MRIVSRWENSFAISSTHRAAAAYSALLVVCIHWFACAYALLPQLMTSWRLQTQHTAALEAGVVGRIGNNESCTGCIAGDASTEAICESYCLTTCELELMAGLTNSTVEYVFNSQHWMCRAVADGLMHADYASRKFDTYMAALLVAMLQLVGGTATLQPANTPEFSLFFVAVLGGTILFAAIQGVICGIVTNGDPEEIQWRQDMDALNFMMTDTKLPHPLQMRVRDYFRRIKVCCCAAAATHTSSIAPSPTSSRATCATSPPLPSSARCRSGGSVAPSTNWNRLPKPYADLRAVLRTAPLHSSRRRGLTPRRALVWPSA